MASKVVADLKLVSEDSHIEVDMDELARYV